MTYTIRAAQWGNAAMDSAVILTDECGAVAVSAVDTPDAWAQFQRWSSSNVVADAPPPPPAPGPTRMDLLEARVAVLEATPPSS